MDVLHNLFYGFSIGLQPVNLLFCFLGVFIGNLIGVLPGVGPVAGVAMAVRCAVVMRGTSMPFPVLFTSRMAEGSGLLPSVLIWMIAPPPRLLLKTFVTPPFAASEAISHTRV